MTAIGMCLDNALPILVFNFKKEGNIERAIAGEPIGTWVGERARRPAARGPGVCKRRAKNGRIGRIVRAPTRGGP